MNEETELNGLGEQPEVAIEQAAKKSHPKKAYKAMYEEAKAENDWYFARLISAIGIGIVGWIGFAIFFILWL